MNRRDLFVLPLAILPAVAVASSDTIKWRPRGPHWQHITHPHNYIGQYDSELLDKILADYARAIRERAARDTVELIRRGRA